VNIERVTRVVSFVIETDSDEYPTYRRSEGGAWENLMGESWEPCYSDEKELEQMYQDYLASL